jgi:hypothetical protein
MTITIIVIIITGNLLVLCETFTPDGVPLKSNTRRAAAAVFAQPDMMAQVDMIYIYIYLYKCIYICACTYVYIYMDV